MRVRWNALTRKRKKEGLTLARLVTMIGWNLSRLGPLLIPWNGPLHYRGIPLRSLLGNLLGTMELVTLLRCPVTILLQRNRKIGKIGTLMSF